MDESSAGIVGIRCPLGRKEVEDVCRGLLRGYLLAIADDDTLAGGGEGSSGEVVGGGGAGIGGDAAYAYGVHYGEYAGNVLEGVVLCLGSADAYLVLPGGAVGCGVALYDGFMCDHVLRLLAVAESRVGDGELRIGLADVALEGLRGDGYGCGCDGENAIAEL